MIQDHPLYITASPVAVINIVFPPRMLLDLSLCTCVSFTTALLNWEVEDGISIDITVFAEGKYVPQ